MRFPTWAVAPALALAAVLGLAACGDSSDGTATTATSSAPSTAAAGSAAGKACIEVDGPVPDGAPEVPVKTGEPPADLLIEDLTAGTGAAVEATASVTVDYIGVACSTGTVFDDSYSRGEPVSFALAQVIPGWQEGLLGMKVGGTRLLGIPPDLAYGDSGAPPDIAPGETLWFVVELKDVQGA